MAQGFPRSGLCRGTNLSLEYRYVEATPEGRAERLAELLTTLIRQNVAVLFSPRPEVVLAAKRATNAIPIVFATIGNPVGTGLVESLNHPGANVTGISYESGDKFAGKQLQLLRELVPAGRSFGLLHWQSPDAAAFIEAARSAGDAMALLLRSFEVHEPGELETAFATLTKPAIAGILVVGSAYTFVHRERIVSLAAAHRLPAIYGTRDSVIAGGLMSYGPSVSEQFRQAAIYIDKILKGTKPRDLPVEQPSKFDLAVNLKTARGLGILFPKSMLIQATEVVG